MVSMSTSLSRSSQSHQSLGRYRNTYFPHAAANMSVSEALRRWASSMLINMDAFDIRMSVATRMNEEVGGGNDHVLKLSHVLSPMSCQPCLPCLHVLSTLSPMSFLPCLNVLSYVYLVIQLVYWTWSTCYSDFNKMLNNFLSHCYIGRSSHFNRTFTQNKPSSADVDPILWQTWHHYSSDFNPLIYQMVYPM